MRRRYIGFILLIFIFFIFYFLILPEFDIQQFIESLKSTNILIFSLALLTLLVSNSFAALRWSILMKEVNAKNSSNFSNAFGIFSLGQATGLIIPTRVGSYSKAPLIIKLDKLSYKTALAAVNAETIVDLVYIGCAGIVSLIIVSVLFSTHFFLSTVVILIIIGCLIITLILLYKIQFFKGSCENQIARLSEPERHFVVKIPMLLLKKLFDLIISTREMFSHKIILAKVSFFTLITQMLGVVGFLLVIESAHESLPLIFIFAILTLSFLIGIISMIPGGLGASDLSMIVLLENAGIALPVASNIALLWRFAMYIPIVAVSGLYLLKMHFFSEE